MAAEEFKRRLTAILSADVEGYSRLLCWPMCLFTTLQKSQYYPRSGLYKIHETATRWKFLIRSLGISFGNTVYRLILISGFQYFFLDICNWIIWRYNENIVNIHLGSYKNTSVPFTIELGKRNSRSQNSTFGMNSYRNVSCQFILFLQQIRQSIMCW